MHRAALLLIFVLGLSSMLWGVRDLADAPADHVTTYVGLAKLGAGAVLVTLAIGFMGLLNAISEQPQRRTSIAPTPLPTWLARIKK
jgi:hypothetical protein